MEKKTFDEKTVRISDKRVSVKLYHADESFNKSILMPTEYYPLPNDNFQVFSDSNTTELEDCRIITLLDTIPYRIGRCYSNSDAVMEAFSNNGVQDANVFCGWMFMSPHSLPLHHCWVVLGDNHVIDFANDQHSSHKFIMDTYGKDAVEQFSMDDWREAFVEYRRQSVHWKNSDRCKFGITNGRLYVGCKVSSGMGEALSCYQALKRKYPDHETDRNLQANGLNKLQNKLSDAGLA